MEIHKANLEAQTTTQKAVSPASAVLDSIPPIQAPPGPPQIFQQLPPNYLLSQPVCPTSAAAAAAVTPLVTTTTTSTPIVSSASNPLTQAAQVSTLQQQLCAAAALTNGTSAAASPAVAPSLPMTYFLRPNTALPVVSSCQPMPAGNIGQHSTVLNISHASTPQSDSSSTLFPAAASFGFPAASQAAILAAAAAAHRPTPSSSSTAPSTPAYHVTPKLKSPAGMLTSITSRGIDKFAPY